MRPRAPPATGWQSAVHPPPPPRPSALRCDLAHHLLPDQLDGDTRESIGRYLGRGGAAWTLAKHAADAAQLLRQLMHLITLEGGGGPGRPGSGRGGVGGPGGRGGAWASEAAGSGSSSGSVAALFAAGLDPLEEELKHSQPLMEDEHTHHTPHPTTPHHTTPAAPLAMPWDEAEAPEEGGGGHSQHTGIEADDELETRRGCLMANNAWLARQWLDSLVSAFEAAVPAGTPGARGDAPGEVPRREGKGGDGGGRGCGQQSEQHAIIVGCFSAAFRSLKLASTGWLGSLSASALDALLDAPTAELPSELAPSRLPAPDLPPAPPEPRLSRLARLHEVAASPGKVT